jgi:hypothetical protein
MVIKSETANISDRVVEKLNELPVEQQQQVLDFVEFMLQKHKPLKSIWDKIQEIMADVPPEDLAEIPADASLNLDHYLYGSPKKTINN